MIKLNIVIPLLGVHKGGGLRVICELANKFIEKGHNVSIICPPIKDFPFSLDNRINLISRTKKEKENFISSTINDFLFIISNARRSGEIIISNYYTTFYIGYVLQIFFNKKHIYFIQGYETEFFDQKNNIPNNIKFLLAKLSYLLKPKLRITISEFLKNKIGKKDIVIINNGIDLNVFKNKESNQISNTKKTICSIALKAERKGFYDFIKAIEMLSNTRNDFDVLLFTNQLDFQFNLSFPYQIRYPKSDFDVVDCYNDSDIFISASHHEGFGLTPLEAMACGNAVITTNSGGINEYAKHNYNTLIVPVGDINELKTAIEKLLDDYDLFNKLILNGKKTVQEFTWEKSSLKFINEIYKIL